MTAASSALVRAVRWYQAARDGRPSPCRYVPSCSSYAIEALSVHGAWRGSWLTLRRLLRCAPWGAYGADPVPPRRDPIASTPEPTSEPEPLPAERKS